MPISSRGEIWFKFDPFHSTHFEFLLLTPIKIYQEFNLVSINYVIMLQFGDKVGKILKNCSLIALCRQKQASMVHA